MSVCFSMEQIATKPNGHIKPEATLNAEQLREANLKTATEALANWVTMIVANTVNGLIFSSRPAVPPQILLQECSVALAKVIGQSYVGEEGEVRRMREVCRRAFRDALRTAPIVGIPKPTAPADTAVKVPEGNS